MSYTTLATPMLWPPYLDSGSAAGNYLLDASGEKVCQILRCPVTGTLDGFEVKLGTVTSAPASGLTFSFQDVDVTSVPGVPDGTADQSSTVTVGISSNAWLVSGTMSRSVTQGDILACVIDFASFAGGDSLNIQRNSGIDLLASSPYSGLYTTSWAMQQASLMMALRYSGGVYYPVTGVAPWLTSTTSTGNVNTGTTPDEVALRFVPPCGCKTSGFVIALDSDNAVDVVLYDGTTAMATCTISPNLRYAATGLFLTGLWSSKQTLTAGGVYYLAIKPTSASSVTGRYLDVNSAAIMAATPGGAELYYATRTDAGAWSTTTTRRLVAQLLISDVDAGSAGGLMRHPGMTGGILG